MICIGKTKCTSEKGLLKQLGFALSIPSLTTYQLIPSVPERHHKETEALLVGNPCLNESKKPPQDCAEEEVEIVALILNTRAQLFKARLN